MRGRGRVTGAELTNTRVNDQPVLEIAFEFEDATRRHRVAKFKTLDGGHYRLGREIPILYLEDEPNVAEPIGLHPQVRLDEHGVHAVGPMTGVVPSLLALGIVLTQLAFALGFLAAFFGE